MALTKVGKEGITGISNSSNATAITIDSSENLLVGTTSPLVGSNNQEGIALSAGSYGGYASFSRSGGETLDLNRKTDDGTILNFRKDGTTIGLIGTIAGDMIAGTGDTGLRFHDGADQVYPSNTNGSARDNAIDLGASGARFKDIYANNATIQTSDANEKQQIAALTDDEITAAKAISALFKTYKWNSAVEIKGDAARTHTGVVAQEVQAAMSAVGLDATKYAFWCSDTWWETSTDVPAVEADEEAGIEAQDAYTRIDTYHTADEAPDGATQRTRMGVRYQELLAFVGAATEQRLVDIETRLTALES